MSERLKEKQLQKAEEAKQHLIAGAVLFARTTCIDLPEALKLPHTVIIQFRYGPESRPGIPLDIVDFANSVYKRAVNIASITVTWFLDEILPDGSCKHVNKIDFSVQVPVDGTGITDGPIAVSQRECYRFPTIRIDVDNIPFRYAVREQTIIHFAKGETDFNVVSDTLHPRVITAVGDILGGLQGQFLPKRRLKEQVKDIVASNFFPELYAKIRLPHRRILITDPEEPPYLLHYKLNTSSI